MRLSELEVTIAKARELGADDDTDIGVAMKDHDGLVVFSTHPFMSVEYIYDKKMISTLWLNGNGMDVSKTEVAIDHTS